MKNKTKRIGSKPTIVVHIISDSLDDEKQQNFIISLSWGRRNSRRLSIVVSRLADVLLISSFSNSSSLIARNGNEETIIIDGFSQSMEELEQLIDDAITIIGFRSTLSAHNSRDIYVNKTISFVSQKCWLPLCVVRQVLG